MGAPRALLFAVAHVTPGNNIHYVKTNRLYKNLLQPGRESWPTNQPKYKTLAFWILSMGPELCRKPIRLGKHTVLATSVDFVCARVGHAEAPDSRRPYVIVKTYDFGTTDEVFASQDMLGERIIFRVKTDDFKSTHRVFASQGRVFGANG